MGREYILSDDKGICEFCGQLIERHQSSLFVRLVDEYEPRICHEECYEDREDDEEWMN